MEEQLFEAVINAGVGALIAIAIIFFTYKLVSALLLKVGAEMVGAFKGQTEAMTRQAVSMEMLTKSLSDYVLRDNSEHREIIILLKVIAERLTHLEEKNGCSERTL
ncbi:MAG: hypothetical protein AABZ15_11750 [Nitrospirota bacterium]